MIDDIDARLCSIFVAAFPGLTAEEAAGADRDRVKEWDSVASVTLATMVEEEFGLSVDFDDVAEWNSYRDVHRSVTQSHTS
jgi:acyl carrier protein